VTNALWSVGLGAALGAANLLLARRSYRRALTSGAERALRIVVVGFLGRLIVLALLIYLLPPLFSIDAGLFVVTFMTLYFASTIAEIVAYLRRPTGRSGGA
jgi:hypothetical protein